MGPSQALLWKIYVGVIGAVTTIAAQRVVTLSWKAITGEAPPSPTDPETPVVQAASWALASAVGVGVTQLLIQRFAARHWTTHIGTPVPKIGKINLSI